MLRGKILARGGNKSADFLRIEDDRGRNLVQAEGTKLSWRMLRGNGISLRVAGKL
jgi:hypothetical protein